MRAELWRLGVNHCLKGLRNAFLFDSWDEWRALWDSSVSVACGLRREVRRRLGSAAAVHEEYFSREHSIEALVPLIAHCWPAAQILPIGVPQFDDVSAAAAALAGALRPSLAEAALRLGHEVVLVLSNDSGHYGSAFKFTPFGVSREGYERQVRVDSEIASGISGELTVQKVLAFFERVASKPGVDRSKSCSLWCGGWPVSVGLLALLELAENRRVNGSIFAQGDSLAMPPLGAPQGSAVFLYVHATVV